MLHLTSPYSVTLEVPVMHLIVMSLFLVLPMKSFLLFVIDMVAAQSITISNESESNEWLVGVTTLLMDVGLTFLLMSASTNL